MYGGVGHVLKCFRQHEENGGTVTEAHGKIKVKSYELLVPFLLSQNYNVVAGVYSTRNHMCMYTSDRSTLLM